MDLDRVKIIVVSNHSKSAYSQMGRSLPTECDIKTFGDKAKYRVVNGELSTLGKTTRNYYNSASAVAFYHLITAGDRTDPPIVQRVFWALLWCPYPPATAYCAD